MGAKGESKKKQIVSYIIEYYVQHKYPPTVREIGSAVGLKSTASVHKYLYELEFEGKIKKASFNSRAIELNFDNAEVNEEYIKISSPGTYGKTIYDDFGSTHPIIINTFEQRYDTEYNEGINESTVSLPIVGQVAAGLPILAEQNIEDYFPIPSGYAPYGELFMLKVKGDSMIEAGILNGDMIMVKKQATANNGEIIVALIDDSATVKTFYKRDNKIILQPENSSMEPIIVDDVTILGKVFGVYRFYK